MKWDWETRFTAMFMCVYLIYNISEGTAGIPILFVLVFVVAPWVWSKMIQSSEQKEEAEG